MGEGITGFFGQYGFLIILVVGMVFLMVIPQRKRKKQMQALMDSLKPGKTIKTIGGIYGKIVAVKEDLVTIEVLPDKTRMVFAKGAIATVEDSEVEGEALDSK